MATPIKSIPRVVIVGAGFGGLNAARSLAPEKVQITIVDRKNHHTFQPLLYQVATAGLSPGEIAAPIRSIFRGDSNVVSLLEEVEGFDLERPLGYTSEQGLPYDYLVVAAGATHSYFGHDEWEPFAPGLKSLEDALEIRRRVLLAYELAERRAAPDVIGAPTASGEAKSNRAKGPTSLNFIVIGGGPTGVELAGALADIARYA